MQGFISNIVGVTKGLFLRFISIVGVKQDFISNVDFYSCYKAELYF